MPGGTLAPSRSPTSHSTTPIPSTARSVRAKARPRPRWRRRTPARLPTSGTWARIDGHLAADHQRGRDPAGQPRQPLRGAHLLARRRPGRARTLLPDRQAELRPAAARRPGAGRGAGAADALAGRRTVYVLDDQDPFEEPLATLVARTPNARGSRSRRTTASRSGRSGSATGEVEKIVASRRAGRLPRAGGGLGASARCGAPAPRRSALLLLGSSSLAGEAFASRSARAASDLPDDAVLAEALYPRPAGRVLAEYRSTSTGRRAVALYGYEAMARCLRRSVGRARGEPSPRCDRQLVLDARARLGDRALRDRCGR